MSRPFASFSVRLALFVVLPLVVALFLGGGLVIGALEQSFEHRLQREVEMVARALRLPVSDAMREYRPDRLQRSLVSALSIGRVYGAHVYDEDGQIVASVGHGASNDPTSGGQRARRRSGGYLEADDGRRIYSYFVPLVGAGDQSIGTLQVTRKHRDFREFMADVRARGIGILGVSALVLGSLVVIGYHGAIGRSLVAFTRSIQRVEAGEREHRAQVRHPTEVGTVARSFNSMLDSIATAEAHARREQDSRIALESRLRQSERLAAIGRLVAGLAHELGTPLSVLDGHCQRSLRDSRTPATQRDTMESIRREVHKMTDLVRQLLDYGRREPRQRLWVTASTIVANAAAMFGEDAASRGVSIEQAGPTDVEVFGNETRLTQALTNLIQNAVHAASSHVRVSWFRDGARTTFVVEDDGPGVSEEARGRLFEPFFTTKEMRNGTGLGLAIVHSVALDHNGEITYMPSERGGAEFILTIPAEDPGGRMEVSS